MDGGPAPSSRGRTGLLGSWAGEGGVSLHEAPGDSEYSGDKDKGPGRSLKKYRLLVAAEGPPPHPTSSSPEPPASRQPSADLGALTSCTN